MSLIHLEKSVLTFHLKEILEDGHGNHPLTWISLGLLILGPKLLPNAPNHAPKEPHRTRRNIPKPNGMTARKGPMSLSQWIAEAKQRELATQLCTAMENQATFSSEKGDTPSQKVLMN